MAEMEFPDLADTETTCTLCFAEFIDPEDLKMHIIQVHSTQLRSTFKPCQFCSETFSNLEEYAYHLRDEHLQSLKCCKYCNRVFNDFDEYRKHESRHYSYVTKSMYSCSQCKKLFHNVSELELHEHKEHLNADDGVFLTECLPLLSSILNIRAVKFLQSLGDEVVYICVRCELTTPNIEDYLNHLKLFNCQSLACDGCSSVYRHKKGLLRHLESHPECKAGGKVYRQCTECYKMFDIRLWRDHTKHCKAIKCKTCLVVFSSMYDLSQHQTKAHPVTVTLLACRYCHKEFAGTLALEKHIKRAHDHNLHMYKYTCVSCSAIFTHPKKLFAHFYSTHKDLEPYTCKICDKKFKIRKKFTIHIKLDHKSIGYIEFDENYHVFFSDKKSEKKENASEASIEQNKTNSAKKVQFDELSEQRKVEHASMNKQDKLMNTNFLSATETEGNQTEVDDQKLRSVRKSRKRTKKQADIEVIISDSSDDEPLVELKKRAQNHRRVKLRNATWNRKKRKDVKDNKRRFICNICKKYCYTFQNYHNHVALHYKNVTLKCVKCSESFKSQEDLNNHYSKEHSTSRLTQTLKNLLEKRKSGVQPNSDGNSAEKFQRTIRKVCIPNVDVTATLKEVTDKLSVQKFIESFTPEEAPKKRAVEINNSVTLRPVSGPIPETQIRLTKCNLDHMDFSRPQLCMPVRYRQVIGESHKATLKEVSSVDLDITQDVEDRNTSFEDETYFGDDVFDKNESIPEVAQEVMLEVTEEPPKTLYIPHRVVLPKLPKEYNKIRIAHLQSEAPYYKIVKVEDVLNPQTSTVEKKKPKKDIVDNKVDIKLPDGTKLVTVNPLAHLLGDRPVDKILENTKNKYYQPKAKDFEVAIAKAMLRLEKPDAFPKRKRKKID